MLNRKQLALAAGLAASATSRPAAAATIGNSNQVEDHDDIGSEVESSLEDFDYSRLEDVMEEIAGQVCGATSAADLEWRLSELIVDGSLEVFFIESLSAAQHAENLEAIADALDDVVPEVRQAYPFFLLTAQILPTLLDATQSAPAEGDDTQLASPLESVFGAGVPDLHALLYDEDLPDAVRDALYAGYVSQICMLTFVAERPMPAWLREELRTQLMHGQQENLRLLIAVAGEVGVALPQSELLDDLEPIDLDAADRTTDVRRLSIESHLRAVKAQRSS